MRGDQRSSRIDFDTIAQQQQLSDRKFWTETHDWYSQDTMANVVFVIEWDK